MRKFPRLARFISGQCTGQRTTRHISEEATIMRYAIASLAAALLTVGLASGTADAQYIYRPQTTTDDVGLVASWYQRYLGRDPEPLGLQGWVNELRRGGRVEAGILGSDE